MDTKRGLGRPYYIFLTGQFVSNLGSAISLVLIPLLVYQLTESPLSLGMTMAAEFLPYPLFGLLIGAYVDRLSRRRVMIIADIGRMLVIAMIPLLAYLDRLSVWWIYAAGFSLSALTIAFNAAEFAVIPTMVNTDQLSTANGRLSAAYSAASVAGPAVASVSLVVWQPSSALLIDAGTFAVSVGCLTALRQALPGLAPDPDRESILESIRTGMRFVFGHPVLRASAILLALTNFFVGATVEKQIVALAKQRFHASDSAVSWLFIGASLGIVVFSLLTARLSRGLSTAQAIMLPFFGGALCIFIIGIVGSFPAMVLVWAFGSGLGMFFIINLRTLRQRVAPAHMLGRVVTVSQVVSWSPIPLGAILGGWVTSEVGSAGKVFAGLGIIQLVIAAAYLRSPLGRADAYLTDTKTEPEPRLATTA